MQISDDPVGAPIFYRDVPLMLSELERGVIRALPHDALPLIAWRLSNVSETGSRLLPEGLHTCSNCRFISRDGRTPGTDLGGTQKDKGFAGAVSTRLPLYRSKIPSRENL